MRCAYRSRPGRPEPTLEKLFCFIDAAAPLHLPRAITNSWTAQVTLVVSCVPYTVMTWHVFACHPDMGMVMQVLHLPASSLFSYLNRFCDGCTCWSFRQTMSGTRYISVPFRFSVKPRIFHQLIHNFKYVISFKMLVIVQL